MYHATRGGDGKIDALYNAPDSTGVIMTETLASDHPDVIEFQSPAPSASELRREVLEGKLVTGMMNNSELFELMKLERGL